MATEDRAGTVAFAAAHLVEDRLTSDDSLESALVPGQRTTTYGRTWVLTKMRPLRGPLVAGRIGIVTDMEMWDEEASEFLPGPVEAGFATPYVLNTASGLIAFQARGSTIKPQSFVNALEHLLNESGFATWRVTLAEREMGWEEFQATVERIEYLSVRLDYPNPRFRTKLARDLVDGVDSASTTVTMRADETGSINSYSEVVGMLMEHADAYGQTTARGPTPEGGRVRWRSRRRRATARAQMTTKAPADPETGEIATGELEELVERWSDIPFFPEE